MLSTIEAKNILEQLYAPLGWSVSDIVGRSRTARLVDMRQSLVHRLERRNFTVSQMARILQRDRTSIRNLQRRRRARLGVRQ